MLTNATNGRPHSGALEGPSGTASRRLTNTRGPKGLSRHYSEFERKRARKQQNNQNNQGDCGTARWTLRQEIMLFLPLTCYMTVAGYLTFPGLFHVELK